MRTTRDRPRADVSFNMTPMIDVVFLLIIFFLLSSHLARRENRLQLPLPVADSGQEAIDEETPRVTVNVLRDGVLQLAGRSVDVAQLHTRLAGELERAGNNLEVRIRADREVPYRHVGPIMLAAARAGIWNITFSVIRSQDAQP
jgi:biopolymer transport protein ExbD